jgi:hypothetical protein
MANETYTLIQKTTLNASAASITFSSIPQTFTDLKIVVSARDVSVTYSSLYIAINGTAVTSLRKVLGNGSSASSGTDYVGLIDGTASTASVFGNADIYIPNYTSSNYKSLSIDMVSENNATGAHQFLTAAISPATTAISTLAFTCDGSFEKYTSVSLYGVAKLGVTPTGIPKASGGDIITNDGTYWIHQFLNSGTFTPNRPLSCGYLVVAGGGGGARGSYGNGGGGGAGGLRSTVTATGGGGALESALSVTAQAYTITVGAGGAGSLTASSNGANSVFSTITSTGGGRGGQAANDAGNTGGSGGGGGTSAGSGTTNQGYAGGTAGVPSGVTGGGGGGGGGANAVGANGAAGNGAAGGAGGAGVSTSITGSSVTYAGGGGGSSEAGSGGAGGTGGGGSGAGGVSGVGSSGTANSGGGGGSGYATVGNGGSGIVIIRYAM